MKKLPARWRRPARPLRMSAMDAFLWNRDRSDDKELYRGNRHLATVSPDERWKVHIGREPSGRENDMDAAKSAAKTAAEKEESLQEYLDTTFIARKA